MVESSLPFDESAGTIVIGERKKNSSWESFAEGVPSSEKEKDTTEFVTEAIVTFSYLSL